MSKNEKRTHNLSTQKKIIRNNFCGKNDILYTLHCACNLLVGCCAIGIVLIQQDQATSFLFFVVYTHEQFTMKKLYNKYQHYIV